MSHGSGYLVGVGIADVTGEAGGVGMMGYALPYQRTAGIHQRQWARAFVVADAGTRVAFVSADLGMIFASVHQEVLRRLAARFGDRYTASNTVLSATHTHSGPGGFSHHTLYNLTTFGFRPRTFEAVVAGIVEAIARADADLAPGTVSVNTGELHGASVNRSLRAFERNPDRAAFPAAIDPAMTVLRLARDGVPVGAFSWFATHGTSMTNTNTLISGDNKGYAAYRWEHDWAGVGSLAKARGEGGFVAGFAQGNAGDMSPNLGAGGGYGPTGNEFANTRVVGERQAVRARELFDAATELLAGPVDHRQRYVDMSQVDVPGGRTWPAVIGQGFTAGTHDGRGLPFIHIGQVRRSRIFRLLDLAVVRAPADVVAGHAPKPVGLATGLCRPHPWTPQVLPLQVIRIGQLAIVAGPGEFTITAGRRVRQAVAERLPGVAHVVFAGYANAYAGYVATPEEYDAQHYEGASTHFGRWTLPAYQQEFGALADALREGAPTPSAVRQPDLAGRQRVAGTARTPDLAPAGQVIRAPRESYRRGEVAVATFHAGNPSNDTRRGGTFLEVQRAGTGGWLTVASDDDWDTVFRWQRALVGWSTARVAWRIPPGAEPGRYRLVHHGDVRGRSYTGVSRQFTVRA
jgi:neutral ceramidase